MKHRRASAISAELFDEYEKLICEKQGSLPAAEVDRLLIASEASEAEFIARARYGHQRAAPENVHVPDEDNDDGYDY